MKWRKEIFAPGASCPGEKENLLLYWEKIPEGAGGALFCLDGGKRPCYTEAINSLRQQIAAISRILEQKNREIQVDKHLKMYYYAERERTCVRLKGEDYG